MELFNDEGYTYVNGEKIPRRDMSEVLLTADLKAFLKKQYLDITDSEIDGIILSLKSISGTIYEANKSFYKLLCDGFILNREDRSKKDIYISLLDFETPENNDFKIVNQFEIEGINNQKRIPDAIVFVNGLPLVVFEFKSAVREETTIADAYTQLTVRYRRDIPELFKYNAFLVISDGANTRMGSIFTPYEYYYAWNKANDTDTVANGISSLFTMIEGAFAKDRVVALLRDFVFYPDDSPKNEAIVCRYPQFFGARKMLDNIKLHLHPDGDGKGGTYFGATGCGKT